MRGVSGTAKCHPNKKHYALGLCQGCYQKRPEYLEYKREYYERTRETWSRYKREYHQRHRDDKNNATRRYTYRRLYGITVEDYDTTLEKQGGHCAICPAREPGRGRKYFVVDHNHETGEFRGLLCIPCNLLLGYAKDSSEILNSAIKYLGGH